MSLYERNGIYWYDFRIGGKRYRGSTKQRKEKKAERAESLIMAKVQEAGELPANKRVPVLSDFSERFFQWVNTSTLEQGSKIYYRTGWNILKETSLRGLRLDHITRDRADIEMGKSAANRNNAIRTLRRMLGKAEEWKLIAKAPKLKLSKELGRSSLIEPWMESKLLQVAKRPLRDVLLIMLDCGMRPAEVFRMRWEDVRFERNAIFVPHGKSHKARRFVPLSERVKDALIAKGARSEGWVFPGRKHKNGDAFTNHGHVVSVQKQWTAAKKAAGIPDRVVLYCGRHTFCTDALQGTGNLAAVMTASGHTKTDTAMIYQHPELDLIRQAINARNESRDGHNFGHSGDLVQ